uniref:Retinoblastoma-associated protein A-box domain-containing protein n=1 Tax=Arcella intermedia TaxID=1963864 RepID=A0A6B2KYG1_9EUKA
MDFIPSLHLLLCCVDFLLGHVPEELKKLKFSELEGKPGTKLDTLLYICRMNHANYDQAREMQKKFYEWLSELCRSKTLTVHNASDPSGAQYLSGLLDRYLLENLKSLNTEYELLLYATGLFDERLFLEGNEQVQSPRPIQASLMTPIKATLGAHDWLVKTLTPLEDSPSPKLKLFYEGQPELLQNLLQKITTWMKPLIFEVENLYRRLLVTKLYFRIFENILVAESKLKSTKYPILLNHDLFNKSLLACCSEVVITAYRENLKFPWILRNYELTGFEFYTIIDCVINNEIGLPENIVKHLRSIEERILEEMGWEKASPIFSKLDAPQRELLKENLEKTRLTQTQGSPSKATTKKLLHKKVDIFLRRVAHLASLRINELADSLASEGTKLTLPLVHHIEYVFNYVLTQTELIQDRHIDQIMMCVLYGVCKVNGIKVTFKQIVDKYSLQPQAVSQTYRAAKLNGEEKGDIIKFYNEVFLNAVESFLNIFTLEGKGGGKENEIKPNPSNLVVLSPLKSQKSPQKIRNLLVSPGSTPLLMKKPGFYFGDVKTRVKRKLDYNFLLGGPEKAAQGIPPYPVQEVEPTAPIPLTHPPRTLEDPLLSFRPLLPLPSQPRVVPSFPATVPPHFTLDKLPPIAHKEPLEDPKLVRSPLQPIKFTTTITRQSQKLPNLSEIFQVEPRMPMVGQEKEKRENKGPAGQNENLPLTNSTTALLEPNKDVKRKLEDSTPSSGNKKPKF